MVADGDLAYYQQKVGQVFVLGEESVHLDVDFRQTTVEQSEPYGRDERMRVQA